MSAQKLNLKDLTNRNNDEDTTIIINQEDNPVDDKISLLAINELLNLDKLKTISRIKPEQVNVLTKLYLFSDTFKAPFTRELADYILQLLISLHGLGRQELVQLVQQRSGGIIIPESTTKKGIFK